jgi:D-psicose/D-tagatose/L-ribulose 3-epimerase
MDRRGLICAGAAALGSALTSRWAASVGKPSQAPMRFRYAACNEMFEKADFASQCRTIHDAGFQGIEIAPFTLADSLDEISAERRRDLRDTIRSEGIRFAGLHWLLITPKWLHLTTADQGIRQKSWDYFLQLIDFCSDLGGGVMVLGSPKQRGSQGNTPADALKLFQEGLARIAPHAEERRCVIAIESLPRKDTDVVNTLQEAVRIVREIRSPAIQTMFDFHNTTDEREPMDLLVREYFPYIRHVHINEMDGRYPGTGNLDFLPVFRVLAERRYDGWISLEVFDFKPGAAEILSRTMAYLHNLEKTLTAAG